MLRQVRYVDAFFCYHYALIITQAHAEIYNGAHTLTNTKPGMGFLLPLTVCLWSMNKKHLLGIQNSLGTEYKCLTTDRQRYTPAHRHNTGGFGTPMLVLLLSIFQHRRRAGYRTGQTHSCLRLPSPPSGGVGRYRLSMISRHIQSASSCQFFQSPPPPPLIQSAAPGCPRRWALAGGWGTGRRWLRGSPSPWRR